MPTTTYRQPVTVKVQENAGYGGPSKVPTKAKAQTRGCGAAQRGTKFNNLGPHELKNTVNRIWG